MSKSTRTASAVGRRVTRSGGAVAPTTPRSSKARQVKEEPQQTSTPIKEEYQSPQKPSRTPRKRAASPTSDGETRRGSKKLKKEEDGKHGNTGLISPSLSDDPSATPKRARASKDTLKKAPAEDLKSKKLKSYSQFSGKSPFPDFAHPTPAECKLAHRILASIHGARTRPKEVVASKSRAGCGDSPSVLDALVRTILSQNTSDTNSTRAKRSMDKVYGGSDEWEAIAAGGEAKLQEAIKCGGLSVVKSKVILSILRQTRDKYGEYSLDHLHTASNEDAMQEMLSFQGVGPKTASCVLLFCLGRESFAVDTHVWRITGLLGWRPRSASRDETHAHLDALIPDEDKYGLHILLVNHGKRCEECRAGGKNLGKCELRKAFRQKKVAGEAGEDVKAEEVANIKVERGENGEEAEAEEEEETKDE